MAKQVILSEEQQALLKQHGLRLGEPEEVCVKDGMGRSVQADPLSINEQISRAARRKKLGIATGVFRPVVLAEAWRGYCARASDILSEALFLYAIAYYNYTVI